jgi:hypothetical protein
MSKKKVREMRFTRRLTDVWIVTDRSTGDHTGLAEDNLGLPLCAARHAGVMDIANDLPQQTP